MNERPQDRIMTTDAVALSRRNLLRGGIASAAALALAGCAPSPGEPRPVTSRAAGERTAAADALAALERETGVTVGVAAGRGEGATIEHRAD
jgi:hypothetical protein